MVQVGLTYPPPMLVGMVLTLTLFAGEKKLFVKQTCLIVEKGKISITLFNFCISFFLFFFFNFALILLFFSLHNHLIFSTGFTRKVRAFDCRIRRVFTAVFTRFALVCTQYTCAWLDGGHK